MHVMFTSLLKVPFVESVSTNIILDLLMVAFISRYCAMVIIEVDMLSQYSDVHGSCEFIELSLCVPSAGLILLCYKHNH